MGQLDVRRTYADGDILLAADLDAFLNDIETFVNVTKLNDDNIQESGITGSEKLVNASVTTGKLANASLTTDKYVNLSVTAAKLAADSVTTSKILDANVTTAKLAPLAVTNDKVADGTLTAIKFAFLPEITSVTRTASTTWQVPVGINSLIVVGAGGGGGGGGYNAGLPIPAGNGGYGGVVASATVTVTPLENIVIEIGAAGIGGAYTLQGTAGGPTKVIGSFGTLTFGGGPGGLPNGGSAPISALVSGGVSAAGGWGFNGAFGLAGSASVYAQGGLPGAGGDGGGGGGSLGTGGVGGVAVGSAPTSGTLGGGGGGGALSAGADGGSGAVKIFYVSKV